MYVSLEEICHKYGYDIKSIKKYDYISEYIIKLFNGENLKNLNKNYKDIILNNNSDIFLWNGRYYEDIEKDYQQMKKYYEMAIELGNTIAMNNLALYYKNIEKDYQQMKKYYVMAIELDNTYAMYNLELYYANIEKDYTQMEKYYFMREKYNTVSIFKLARLYDKKYLNKKKALEYYFIFFETCPYDCIEIIIRCFFEIKNKLNIYT